MHAPSLPHHPIKYSTQPGVGSATPNPPPPTPKKPDPKMVTPFTSVSGIYVCSSPRFSVTLCLISGVMMGQVSRRSRSGSKGDDAYIPFPFYGGTTRMERSFLTLSQLLRQHRRDFERDRMKGEMMFGRERDSRIDGARKFDTEVSALSLLRRCEITAKVGRRSSSDLLSARHHHLCT